MARARAAGFSGSADSGVKFIMNITYSSTAEVARGRSYGRPVQSMTTRCRRRSRAHVGPR
jgi:hypothetical protein